MAEEAPATEQKSISRDDVLTYCTKLLETIERCINDTVKHDTSVGRKGKLIKLSLHCAVLVGAVRRSYSDEGTSDKELHAQLLDARRQMEELCAEETTALRKRARTEDPE